VLDLTNRVTDPTWVSPKAAISPLLLMAAAVL